MVSPYRRHNDSLLQLQGIRLNYGPFRALRNINLSLARAEIHAIVGEHGAGKSSLGMVISGNLEPQAGQMHFDTTLYRSFTLKSARQIGIEMVRQHTLSLNTFFTIAENFALDIAPVYHLRRQKKALHDARAFLARYGIDLDPAMQVKKLTVSGQMFVDILKRIYPQPKLLILDESLEKLTATDFATIVRILMRLKREGMTILLITHRIDDIYHLADRVSIIKNGEVLLTDAVENIDKMNLIKMAYIQIEEGHHIDDLNQEFYQLLKYNEAILRNLPVNLIITDNEQRIKMVNEYCRQYFQLERASYLNIPLHEFMSSTNDEMRTVLTRLPPSGREQTLYKIPIQIYDRSIISNITIFPIYDGTALIGSILIIQDMTEYDRLESQVILSEKLASVGLLAAGVAHEINNPLEIISNSLTFLKYHVHRKDLLNAVDDIQGEMSSISQIVSNLHSFSDNAPSLKEHFDLNDLVRDMLKLLRYHARSKHIHIHFSPSPDDATIRANKNEIKQVLLNLFKNSFEALPYGGEIFIETSCLQDNETDDVKMTFRDTGPGICDDNPSNIFLPFYSSKKGAESHLGLGLSVSYGIITKYQGTITVQNLEEAGCQFVITFPQSK